MSQHRTTQAQRLSLVGRNRMKSKANIILICVCTLFTTLPTFAGGDLGGGGLRDPKKKLILSKVQKKKFSKAKSVSQQKALWLDSLTVDDEELIYDAVFKEIIQPQLNPVAEE